MLREQRQMVQAGDIVDFQVQCWLHLGQQWAHVPQLCWRALPAGALFLVWPSLHRSELLLLVNILKKFFREVGLAWQYKLQCFCSSTGKLESHANVFTFKKMTPYFLSKFFTNVIWWHLQFFSLLFCNEHHFKFISFQLCKDTFSSTGFWCDC